MVDVVVTFGRMNPPTTAHLKLCATAQELAGSLGCKCFIYLSNTVDETKNPLMPSYRRMTILDAFKGLGMESPSIIVNTPVKDVIGVLKAHSGADTLYFVCGEDREEEYRTLFDKYNHVEYDFKKIVVYSILRDDDVSATKARQLAVDGDYKEFSKIVIGDDKEGMFRKVRWVLAPYNSTANTWFK